MALHFELLPPAWRRRVAERLVQRIHECQDHLATGFVGTPYLLFVLEQTGHLDLAYKLLLNDDFPSWGYPIKHGATTMWERWDGWRHDKGFQDAIMNSFNHYAYGAVGEWMYRRLAGLDLDPAAPGGQHLRICPQPGGGLTHARVGYDSIHGRVEVRWRQTKRVFHLRVVIPANTRATVCLPTHRLRSVTESGVALAQSMGVSHVRVKSGRVVCELAAGQYEFACP